MLCPIEWLLSPYMASAQGITWLLTILGLAAAVARWFAGGVNAVLNGREGAPFVYLLTILLFVIIAGVASYLIAERLSPTLGLAIRQCTAPSTAQRPTKPPPLGTRIEPAGNRSASPESAPPSDARADDREVSFWTTVVRADTEEMYRSYLDRYPQGQFAGLARARVAEITNAARAAELNLWRAATHENSIAAYDRYLNRYPEGEFAGSARAGIAQIRKAAEEAELNLWRATVTADTVSAYHKYLGTYPQGRFAPDAQRRISELNASRQPSPSTSGYPWKRDGRARMPSNRPH